MIKKIIKILAVCAVITAAFTAAVNLTVIKSTQKSFVSSEEAAESGRCVVVLGAAVKNGGPSLMLKDRLDKAIEIYNLSDGECVLVMSGNGGANNRPDEIDVMTEYAVKNGVSEEKIVGDPKGYSTYESMYRMINELGYDEFTVVTQKYHLYRALYSAEKLGADVQGVPAEDIRYYGQMARDIREILARVKDFGLASVKYEVK